ncbi:MAG: hypothetical protein HC902_07375 [Calothrix sp. SM1_5_4]|nr:hypothetical protein [Calothrix sp. SM1_5_4]
MRRHKKRILLICENRDISLLTRLYISRSVDCEILDCNGPEQAEQAFKTNHFDLIVLDMYDYSRLSSLLRLIKGHTKSEVPIVSMCNPNAVMNPLIEFTKISNLTLIDRFELKELAETATSILGLRKHKPDSSADPVH